ncbi:cohesin domain-containing protein [Salinibacter ruber]|uniref:Secretion system C-terminal sorting domain-containing protein n=1 Tax=Salinibacter ruber TaxID=146919 RepID=A0A9X2QDT3_9BACT|nr:cohesin domain-containing protein [Salinibacter ruber]MCS3661494.1 hypothetical protein [Salinibacter ruber]MCS3711277.1 hypothetical protein [Salinibacter ruber]
MGFLLGLAGLAGPVAEAQVPVRPAAGPEQAAGTTFQVEITVGTDSASVEGLFGASLVLGYDASRVSVVGDEAGPFLGPDVVYQSDIDEEAGEIGIGVTRKSGDGGTSGSGLVAQVEVAVPDTAQGEVLSFNLRDVRLTDASGESIGAEAEGLEVDVRPAPPIRPVVAGPVTPRDTFRADVTVGTGSAPAENVFGTSFVLRYDPDRMSVVEDEAGPFLGPDVVYQSNVDSAAGEVGIGVSRKSGGGGASGSGAVAQVEFAVAETVPPGTELPLEVREASASDPEESPLPLSAEEEAVTLKKQGPPIRPTGPSEVPRDSVFSVEVKIGTGSSEAEDLFGASFTLGYDASRVSVVGDEAGPFLGPDVVYQSNVDSMAGEVGIGVSRKSGSGGASGSGVVARVRVEVPESAPGEPDLSFDLSEVTARDSEGTPLGLSAEGLDVSIRERPLAAEPDTFSVEAGATLSVGPPGVLGNDDGSSPTAQVAADPSEGSLTLGEDGSFEYVPDEGFSGTDEFDYEAVQGSETSRATVTIEVQDPSVTATEPVEAGDAGSTVEFGETGTSVSFSSATSGSGDVTVSRFEEPPATTTGIEGNASEYRVEVSLSGDLSVGEGTEIRFDAGKLDGASDPSEVTIYTREVPGSGSFSALETTYDEGADQLVATVSSFSEFAFGSETEPLFAYPDRVEASVSRSFGDAAGPGDYRLVALPGTPSRALSGAVGGEAGSEWQAYWDDGSSFVRHDGSETFQLREGRGFWLTSRQAWTVEDSIEAAPLRSDTAAVIPVNPGGWTIVANPFGEDVSWDRVVKANGGDLSPLWPFEGAFNDTSSAFKSARSGQAYYVLNQRSDRDSIVVPYPGAAKGATTNRVATKNRGGMDTPTTNKAITRAAPGDGGPLLELSVRPREKDRTASHLASTVRMGLASEPAGEERLAAPPGQLEALSLRIEGEKTSRDEASGEESKKASSKGESPDGESPGGKSSGQRLLMAERRAASGQGTVFSLQLRRRVEGAALLSASSLKAAGGRSVALIVPSTGQSYNLREDAPIELRSSKERQELKVAIGTSSYVDGKREAVLPEKVRLTSYPNPIRQQGTLEYALPEAREVSLQVYDVLGRKVKTLTRGQKEAGRHRVDIRTGQLSSGIYFGRLKAGGQTRTQKITVVR